MKKSDLSLPQKQLSRSTVRDEHSLFLAFLTLVLFQQCVGAAVDVGPTKEIMNVPLHSAAARLPLSISICMRERCWSAPISLEAKHGRIRQEMWRPGRNLQCTAKWSRAWPGFSWHRGSLTHIIQNWWGIPRFTMQRNTQGVLCGRKGRASLQAMWEPVPHSCAHAELHWMKPRHHVQMDEVPVLPGWKLEGMLVEREHSYLRSGWWVS